MNNKIKSIVKFNLYKNIQNKWFIILNIVMLIVTIIGVNFDSFKNVIDMVKDDKKFNINVYDENNLLYDKLNFEINNNEKLKEKFILTNIINDKELQSIKEKITKDDVIVEVKYNFDNIKVISKEGIDSEYYKFIYDNIKKIKNEDYALKHNISIDNLNNILKEPDIERIMINVDSKNSTIKTFLNQASNYVIFLIFMIVLSKVANDISQEKISKSIEYVLTSINEKDYLISKVISINLIVIVQFIFAFVYYIIATSINRIININSLVDLNTNSINFNIDTSIIIYILASIILSVLTTIILTTVQAAISSKTTNVSEASNATFLLVMINMIIYFISSFLITPLKTPNIIMYIVSCIPIISMYFIPSMIIVGNYNLIIVPIAIIINIIAVPYVFKICSKIFKKGVLSNNIIKKETKLNESIDQKVEKEIIKSKFKNVGFVTAMAIMIYVILNNLFVLLFGMIAPKITFLPKTTIDLISQSIIFIISLYIPSRFVRLYNNNEETKKEKKFKLKDIIKDISMSVSIVIIVQVILDFILREIGIDGDLIKDLGLYKFSNNFDKVLFFIQIAVLPAIFEEILMRRELLNLSKKISVPFGIVFTSIIFGAIHLNLSQSVFAFIIGLVLANIAIKYDSIKISSIIHFLNNGIAALLIIFENNKIIINLISLFIIVVFIYGIINIIIKIIKYLSNIKTIKKECKSKNKSNVKYLFYDYTFNISLIFIVILFIVTQLILNKI